MLGAMQLDINGLSLHVKIYGESGDPILLLPGALTTAEQNWRRIVDPLSQRHRLITIDQRGHGRTNNPTGSFTLADLRNDALGVLDALEIEKVHLLGNSLGGYVSLALRDAYPDRVGTLALAGVKVGWEAEDAGMRGEFFRVEVIEETYPLWAPYMGRAHGHHYGPEHWKTLIDQIRELLQTLPDQPSASLERLKRDVDVHDLFYVLGDRDEMVPLAEVLKIREARPDSEVMVLPRAGHLFAEYDPTIFTTGYVNFLRRRRLKG